MGLVFYLKLCGLAAMGLVAALVFRRGLAACHECVRGMSTQATMSPSARYEQIVEFTYSRTRLCNTDYYNYAFSVGPLMDLIQSWKRDQGASRYDFR